MQFLRDVNTVRNVDWGVSYNWDCQFLPPDNPPDPFDVWFPAVSIEENIVNVVPYQFASTMSSYALPQSSYIPDFRVTFHDDDIGTLYRWFQKWVNVDTFHFDMEAPYLTVLGDLVRAFRYIKYTFNENGSRNIFSDRIFWVYPEGSLPDSGGSDPSLKTFTIMLRVCGRKYTDNSDGLKSTYY